MKFKPYPDYKDSGLEWIGEIPKEWNIQHFKRLTTRIDVGIAEAATHAYRDEGVPILRSGNIKKGKINDKSLLFIDQEFANKNLSKYLRTDDLLTVRTGEAGSTAVVPSEYNRAHCFTMLISTLKRDLEPKYFSYFLNSQACKAYFDINAWGTAQKNISVPILGFCPVLSPDFNEQIKIVDFLDKKTSEIDLTIEKDTRLIELLKEKRTALINHLVTKGLDPTVKMKDSGVEWIGEIPEDWNARKLKFFVSKIGSGITPKGGASVYVENGIALLRSQNIHFDGLRLKNVSYITEETNKTMLNSVVKNKDVLLNITGASIGRCTYFENQVDRANVNQHVCIIRPKTIFHRFLNYVLMSNIGQDQIFSTQMGSSREGVNFEQIGNFVITYPPYEEQEAIANYLDKSTQKIDLTIQKIQEKINFLEEYKKSLIHHVVTGKVDVREVVV